MENPQAFPRIKNIEYLGEELTEEGMTLRDYFAGQYLINIAAIDYGYEHNNIAKKCYKMADSMLEERAKKEEK